MMDALDLLLDDDQLLLDMIDVTEINIPCLNIDHSACCTYLKIQDSLFNDDKYSEKLQIILKYLKNDKHLNNKHQKFDLSIDLTEKELEIYDEETNALLYFKYMLELSKKYITSLSIYITAYRDKRQLPFNQAPPALDNQTVFDIFDIIYESISKYGLQNIIIHWIPVHNLNYAQIQNGIANILNITHMKHENVRISINILFTCLWLLKLDKFDSHKIFIKAISECKICNDLTLKFDKDATWLSFSALCLRNMIQIFGAISRNPHITSLSVFVADNICKSNEILNALRDCLCSKENLNILRLSVEEDLCPILEALNENENISLKSLFLYRNGTNWDSRSIRLICDLMESEEHEISQLVLDGVFVTSYSFGMYRVIDGFDKLINCLTHTTERELQSLKIATISDDGDSDIYTNYVLQLIKQSNIWLSSITIKYDIFTSVNAIIGAFFHRLQCVYKSLQCAAKQLSNILHRNDVISLIIEFCKMECFEIFIVDGEEYDHTMDLRTERAEFRDSLYSFFEQIQYEITPKIAKNRKEFQQFRQTISTNEVGIWRQSFKEASHCISVIL